jgi:hypothetical protein
MNELATYVREGGPAMFALIGVSTLLWSLITLRWWTLRTLAHQPAAAEAPAPFRWLDAASVRADEADWAAAWIRALVLVAPLLGLLGTVSGMVQTFAALAGTGVQGTTMADGIGRAMVTTQFGLLIAVPATFVGRALDRRAERLTASTRVLDTAEAA